MFQLLQLNTSSVLILEHTTGFFVVECKEMFLLCKVMSNVNVYLCKKSDHICNAGSESHVLSCSWMRRRAR